MDLLKLPLPNISSLIKRAYNKINLKKLIISLRFRGQPLPSQIKLHGIDAEESD
uniref:Uncharacterized protein n=1 Tax=Chondria sp. (in: red algae) TaxID=1982705 RepID=A0A1Z1MER8_9FLOR|nr:hypothetical protein [Chondria sp. (in: red algae)]